MSDLGVWDALEAQGTDMPYGSPSRLAGNVAKLA